MSTHEKDPTLGVNVKFARENIVHIGLKLGPRRVYFLCERNKRVRALYGGSGHRDLPVYKLDAEIFRVYDDVDCMTCLSIKARGGAR